MITTLLLAAALTGQVNEAVVIVGKCKICGAETNSAIVAFKEADLRYIDDTIHCLSHPTQWLALGGGSVKISGVMATTHVVVKEILPANGPAGNRKAWARVLFTKRPVSLAGGSPHGQPEPLIGKEGFVHLWKLELINGGATPDEEVGDLTFNNVSRPAREWHSLWRRYAAAVKEVTLTDFKVSRDNPRKLPMYFASINRQAERFCQFHRLRPETLAGLVLRARLSSWPTEGDGDKAAIDRLFIRLPLAWEKQELAEQLRTYPFLSALSGGGRE